MISDLLPAVMPDVWGEGLIFGFSGMDGQTVTRNGFVATLADSPYDVLIHTPRKRRLEVSASFPGRIRAATGDLAVVELAAGELVLVWAAWHTLVGRVPNGVQLRMSFADGLGKLPPSTPPCQSRQLVVTRDEKDGSFVGLLTDGGRFALCHAGSEAELRARCEAGLAADLSEVVRQRLAYLDKLPVLGDPARDRLLRKCASVMKVNVLSPEGPFRRMWSTPDRVPHKHLWLWDTVFHSFAMNLFDPKLSRELLRAMLDTLWTAEDAAKAGQPEREGMMSHMCCVDGTRSHVTQPPILAWGVLENTKRLGVTADLAEILPTLEAYLEWDLAHRDRNRNGLLEWHMEGQVRCRCGESGLDNSPRFDSGEFLDAVDFSAFASHDMRCLAELLVMTGHTKRAALWRKRAEDMENDIQAMLWSEADGFYYDRTMDGQLTGVKAVSGFFPLLLPSVPADRAKRLAAMLNSTHFQARFPIPSVAATDREFSTDMWRGATWANTNYVALLGLERHGFKDEAAALREATIRMVQKHYEQSGVLFEFFDAADRVPPSACDRKGPPDGKPYLMGKVNSIRDYHWTAAVTACLLLSHTAGFPTNSGRQRIERP